MKMRGVSGHTLSILGEIHLLLFHAAGQGRLLSTSSSSALTADRKVEGWRRVVSGRKDKERE